MYERKILGIIKKYLGNSQIIILTGARQTGKTTVLSQLNSYLSIKGVVAFYITLEDPSVLAALNEHPENIFQFIRTGKERIYLLMDEIQYLKDPSNFLKLLNDKYKEIIKVVATGSSAFYMDMKFVDSLAGRKRIFELYPLDFDEFLLFRSHEDLIAEWNEIRNKPDYVSSERKVIESLFDEYLTYGGYPAVVNESDPEEKKIILKELFSSYLKRDIIEAGVQNQDKFYHFMVLLAHQCGALFNTYEMANTLKLSVTAIDNYIYILRKCFHITLVRPFYSNVRKELTKMPRMYFNDSGFRNVIINQFSSIPERIDRGILVENYIFIRLRQLYGCDNLRFWRTADGNEVDFIISETQKKGIAIEAKFSQSEFRISKYKKFTTLYPGYILNCRAYHSDSNSCDIIGL